MSFLGLGGSPNVSSQAKIQAAEAELDMVTGMFNQLVDICHKKCIGTSYNASDLDKNESLCVDRCVAKYFDTNLKVGDSMQKVGQNGAFGVNR
ncbi:TIM10 complex subunit [Komagataella phaffii CBS 7435]|uniref:Mitochondrial import inner membrane translocase subunit n=2 Tax=Komagataella phaffii TaxID=460519 RepID=C4R294_KOMPG|nr:Essential protein of the mitochondrial intermembrane space, forms a complex with Tim9p [Komagataella phaffii GS115]CAH2447832.1 TIM10 complex subunit [Komagataella phaffii CBS 7435]CAY69618.1 Essential protein of the mitochondrial intermembrane space, forms a complex with Tim9p [Komagataella phaffii GS115]SCV12001.1 TIM10 complex subunit [Komagataella phaffii CBS 7435]